MAGPPPYEFAPEPQPGVSKTPESPIDGLLVTGEELETLESTISRAKSGPPPKESPLKQHLNGVNNQESSTKITMSKEQDDEKSGKKGNKKGGEKGNKKGGGEELILPEEVPPILVNDDERKRQKIAEKLGIE